MVSGRQRGAGSGSQGNPWRDWFGRNCGALHLESVCEDLESASDLSRFQAALADCSSHDLLKTVDQEVDTLVGRVDDRASQSVDNMIVRDRRRVHLYYPLLWVWHRLESIVLDAVG